MMPSTTTSLNGGADILSAAAPVAPARPWPRLVTAFFVVECAILFWPTAAWLFDRWTISVWQHAHGLLIPPVVGYFIYQELTRVRHLPRTTSPWGFVLLAPALALHALDAGMHTQLLSAAALFAALPGLSLLLLGTERTRQILFPLAFLFFALPIPLAFTEQIHWQLREVATWATSSIVPWFGVPVFVEGTTLHTAQGVLQVADACSGFSTLYASIAVACLTAYSTRSTRRRIMVMLSAAPVAIGANILRVSALVLLVVWKGPGILETFIHPLSGMLTFALALPIIFWLGDDSRDQAKPEATARRA